MSERNEIKRLRAENRRLKKQLNALKNQSAEPEIEHETTSFSAGNYFAFLLSRLRQKSIYATLKRFNRYFRSSMLVTRIFKYGLIIYNYLQAGAFVILYTVLFITVIPILLSFALVTLIVALILRKRNADKLISESLDSVVFIISPDKEFFCADTIRRDAEKHKSSTVIVVSPYFFGRHGVGTKRNMYVCMRHEYENIYIVRRYFFFYLRKRMEKVSRLNTETLTEKKFENQ